MKIFGLDVHHSFHLIGEFDGADGLNAWLTANTGEGEKFLTYMTLDGMLALATKCINTYSDEITND